MQNRKFIVIIQKKEFRFISEGLAYNFPISPFTRFIGLGVLKICF